MLTLYGIKSCDSCRKARKWLDAHDCDYRFHDLRADGLDESMLARWSAAAGWQALLNTRSTTWRGLADDDRTAVDEGKALALMRTHPTLVKRPVAESGDEVLVGFSPGAYETAFGQDPP
jgi:Spx/MgsR family transcriptional regulator